MINNFMRLLHVGLIFYIFYYLFSNQIIPLYLTFSQIILTVIRSLLQKRTHLSRMKIQVLLSLVLGYALFPNKFSKAAWIFFFKAIEIHRTLKDMRDTSYILKGKSFKYLAFLFDYIRYSISQYTFIWFVSIFYRYLCDQANEPIPDLHKLVYQLIVTASTIGYGDLTPKSDMQIIFFTVTIPILCVSFVVYVNSLVQIYTNTFLEQDHNEKSKKE